MASQDVEEIFKGVLTDESQESRESCGYAVQTQVLQQAPSSSSTVMLQSPHQGNF